ncbi:MAG: NAD(+)--dinitrogen-reductase ADP-D-ribosyltransferase [Gammaproteobacteria bacterium]|nr:NAD(+)--dinitrogen-reductase ADP-D-ribosyltransferase [Gammaproteobacteria bacterium]
MTRNSDSDTTTVLRLPITARLPINRCNLPPQILGSLTFARHPVAITLDGVAQLHAALWQQLETLDQPPQRALNFHDYMSASFLLDNPEEAGFAPDNSGVNRLNADYLRTLRGWLFDSNSKEAAVLKGWVESRFGLLPRHHHGALNDFNSDHYQRYLADRSAGLYNSNALESQLDLLYTYCQYELNRRWPSQSHSTLYRGINRIHEYQPLAKNGRHYTLLLNNLNSFTASRERADEFGDTVIEVAVPLSKLLYFPDLLPGILQGEEEYLVIGGVYEGTILPPAFS